MESGEKGHCPPPLTSKGLAAASEVQHRGRETFTNTLVDYGTATEVLEKTLETDHEKQKSRVAASLARRKAQKRTQGVAEAATVGHPGRVKNICNVLNVKASEALAGNCGALQICLLSKFRPMVHFLYFFLTWCGSYFYQI